MHAALVCLLLLPADAAPPAGEPAEALVARLGNSVFEEREAVTRALEARGESALPALRSALLSPDAEVRRRAKGLVRVLERQVLTRRALAPSRFRLECKEMAARDVVAEIARLSGQPLVQEDAASRPGPRITLAPGETTFWEAVDALESAAGLGEADENDCVRDLVNVLSRHRRVAILCEPRLAPLRRGEGHYRLTEKPGAARPTFHAGALRLQLIPGPPSFHRTRRPWELHVTPEPRLGWQAFTGLHLDRALDDRGEDVRLGRALTVPDLPLIDGEPMQVVLSTDKPLPANLGFRHIPLPLAPTPRSKSLRELRGTLSGWVRLPPGPLVSIEKPLDKAVGVGTGPDGTTVKVQRARELADGCWDVGIEVRHPPLVSNLLSGHVKLQQLRVRADGTASVSEEGNPFRLLDAAGKEWGLKDGSVAPGFEVASYALVFKPGRAGQAVRLVYVGRASVEVQVPFVFRDVPLE